MHDSGTMGTAVETDLLERAPSLAELGQRLEESRKVGRLVLIGGEAGVGKTALLRRFCVLHRAAPRYRRAIGRRARRGPRSGGETA